MATTTPALGAGLEAWLHGAQPGWHVGGVVADRSQLLARLQPDLSLVVASACLDGVLVVSDVVGMSRRVPLLVLVSDPDPVLEADMLRAGAMAVLWVKAPRDDLVRTADDLIRGRSSASAAAMDLLAQGPPAIPGFTERQREILRLLSEGRTTEEIALSLVVTQSTVKTHIGRLAARLGLSGRQELEARAADLLRSGGVVLGTTPESSLPATG